LRVEKRAIADSLQVLSFGGESWMKIQIHGTFLASSKAGWASGSNLGRKEPVTRKQ